MIEIKTSFQIVCDECYGESQNLKYDDTKWVRVEDVKKIKSTLIKLIDNMKVRGMYMKTYSLIEYAQVMVNIDTVFRDLEFQNDKHES